METKLVVGSCFVGIRFNEKSSYSSFLGFISHWDYKHYIEYTGQKPINLNIKNITHLKCDAFDGSIVSTDLREPVLYSFILDKPPGYEVFCQPKTIQCRKLDKSVLNTRTFFWKMMFTKS